MVKSRVYDPYTLFIACGLITQFLQNFLTPIGVLISDDGIKNGYEKMSLIKDKYINIIILLWNLYKYEN